MGILQRIEIAGRRFVLLEESDFERLRQEAGRAARDVEELPPLPNPGGDGLYPAKEYLRVSLAREFITRRKQLGLSQKQLAELAGIRVKSLAEVESGQHTPRPRLVDKIVDALEGEEGRRSDAQPNRPRPTSGNR